MPKISSEALTLVILIKEKKQNKNKNIKMLIKRDFIKKIQTENSLFKYSSIVIFLMKNLIRSNKNDCLHYFAYQAL